MDTSVKKDESQPTAPTKNSPYSDKELRCKGCACAKCGNCRDWYWRPDGNQKAYTKRDGAACTYNSYRFRYNRHGRGFGDDDDGIYYHALDDDYSHHADCVCKCEDNRSEV